LVSWFFTLYSGASKKTFVINFGGEALEDESFEHLIHDFALLSSLGIRLVLVHGIRPQIDARLQALQLPPTLSQCCSYY
jgi:amino-acid N-acetyltransferase